MAIGKQKSRLVSRYGNSGDAYKELQKHAVHGVTKFIGASRKTQSVQMGTSSFFK
jgi:hypothetical protein